MRTTSVILLVSALLLGSSCALPLSEHKDGEFILKPQGEQIRLLTKDNRKLEGEFLFCDEQSIYVLSRAEPGLPGRVQVKAYPEIRELRIQGLANRGWLTSVLGFQIAPALLLGATYGFYSENDWGGAARIAAGLAIPGLLSSLFFELSVPPQPKLTGEIYYEKIKDFMKYARYPFIPDPELKQKILDGLKHPSLKMPVKLP